MNNREAITLLRNLEDSLDSYCGLNEEGKTAFRMAIEALSCSEFPNNSDTISRKERKMTDTEMRRREAICKVAGVSEIDDVSDGFHTFRQLYYQRMMLFAAIVRQNKDKAWKSFRHEDGELCFGGGWFIVGIDTPEGSYTYHYEDSYFGLFDCEELKRGKHWDGHTEKDVTRLLSLPSAQPDTTTHDSIPAETGKNDGDRTSGDCISRQAAIDAFLTELTKRERKNLLHTWSTVEVKYFVVDMLEKLPSAQPERKTGHWILDRSGAYCCDNCMEPCATYAMMKPRDKFCKMCGAKMECERKE